MTVSAPRGMITQFREGAREIAMAESLGQKQRRFARAIPRLIDMVHTLGLECTIGDVFRDPRAFGHYGAKRAYSSAHSNHKLKLAIDINLFRNGRYLSSTSSHRELGLWWMAQGEDHEWGGAHGRSDGNHYSIRHQGRW